MRAKEKEELPRPRPEGTFFSRPNEASDEGFAEKRTTETREYFTEAFDPVVQTSTNQEILSLTRSRSLSLCLFQSRHTQASEWSD